MSCRFATADQRRGRAAYGRPFARYDGRKTTGGNPMPGKRL